jgi:NTE family protein
LARRPLSLALQGGGAHGAFAWGVLDALIEDGRFEFRAASGASAGAMNAVVMANGLERGDADGARADLERFWTAISRAGSPFGDLGLFGAGLGEGLKEGVAAANALLAANPFFAMARSMTEGLAANPGGGLSPYQFNPFNFNPLRDALVQTVDFAALRRAKALRLFVAATSVRTGRLKVFDHAGLDVDHVLASACLPYLFQTVEIEGEPYWDGGFSANPPLWPLFYDDLPRDVLVVSLNPFTREGPTPHDMAGVIDRMNEIAFNASLFAEFRALDFVNRLNAEGLLNHEGEARYRPVRLHLIAADGYLSDLPLSSKFTTDRGFLFDLRDRGARAARAWLTREADHVGRRSSVDVRKDFL